MSVFSHFTAFRSDPALAKPCFRYRAGVVRIVDGDTIALDIDLGCSVSIAQTCRLLGINAPEMDTDEGVASRNALIQLVNDFGVRDLEHDGFAGRLLTVETHKDKLDKYGRLLVVLFGRGGTNLNAEMVRMGHAKEYLP